MTKDPDAYAIWGDWDLQRFKVQIARWRRDFDPPEDVVTAVTRWWPRLRQPLEWVAAAQWVSVENDPEQTLRWMWVPGGQWLDERTGLFRTQCYFRVLETRSPPLLVCTEFRSVRAMTPPEVDRAERFGPPPAR